MTPDLATLVAQSMDAPEELLAHLPELFADLDDLGGRASDVVTLLDRVSLPKTPRVLDLGCGKGAAALRMARTFSAQVHGVDGLPAFVTHARDAAARAGLGNRCTFTVGDIRDVVTHATDHDVVLMLALGDLLGSTAATASALARCAKPGGYVVLDDAYLAEPFAHLDCDDEDVHDRDTAVRHIEREGLQVVEELITDSATNQAWLRAAAACVLERARALAQTEPTLAPLLDEFATRQVEETQEPSEDALVGVMWLCRVQQSRV